MVWNWIFRFIAYYVYFLSRLCQYVYTILTFLILLQATDADVGKNAIVSFSMLTDNQKLPFFVRGSDGVIFNSRTFNASGPRKFTFKVVAENRGTDMRSQFANVIVSGRIVEYYLLCWLSLFRR